MSCRSITQIIRQARNAGILIELDENGDVRLRAPNEPPQAMVQHLCEHKRELVAFLRAKAVAEEGERRMSRATKIGSRGAVRFRSGRSARRRWSKRCRCWCSNQVA